MRRRSRSSRLRRRCVAVAVAVAVVRRRGRRRRRRRHDNGGRHAVDVDVGDGLALLAVFTIADARRHCDRHRWSRWADSTRPDASTAGSGRGRGTGSRDAGGVVGGGRVQGRSQPGAVVGRTAVGGDRRRAGHEGGLGDGLDDRCRLSTRRGRVATVRRHQSSCGQRRRRRSLRRRVLGRSPGLQRRSGMLREGQGRPEQGPQEEDSGVHDRQDDRWL